MIAAHHVYEIKYLLEIALTLDNAIIQWGPYFNQTLTHLSFSARLVCLLFYERLHLQE